MREKLIEDYRLLEKQRRWIEISLLECQNIGTKEVYDTEEFGKFELLCSRYSRGIDFLIRKIFRSLDSYEFENQGTLIDVVNNAHKRGLFDDMDKLRIMKDIRNTLVHEYVEDEIVEYFEEVLSYSDELIKIIDSTLKYIAVNVIQKP